MGITALSGPNVTYGVTVKNSTDGVTGVAGEYNGQRAPNINDLGNAMADPRAAYNYNPGQGAASPFYAFYGGRGYVDYVPLTAVASNIVSNTASSGVSTFTLVAASSAGGTYSTDLVAPETGLTISSVLTFDSSAAALSYNSFGSDGAVRTWAPGWGAGRCISVVTTTGGDSPVTIVGRDAYGYKISEQVQISNTGSVTSSYGGVSRKAFKYVTAAYNSTTPVSTGIKIGTCDRFGVPLYTPYLGGDITVRVSSIAGIQNAAVALTSANFTLAAASTITQTSTTADVRGVYLSTLAADGTVRLQISVTPSASAVASVTQSDMTLLFGALQYSSV